MNFGEIKSFLNGTSLFDTDKAKGQQGAGGQIRPNLDKLGGAAAIVQRSQSSLLGFNVLNKVVNDKLQSLDSDAAAISKKNDNLFDFDEVAKNVLSFVEKAVMKAKGSGADDGKLTDMLAQARKGIDEGFTQARAELDEMGEMNDEVGEGIDKSYQQIQEGLSRFEDKLFGPDEMAQLSVSSAELNYSLAKSSSITIQTNDGDSVTIDFAEALSYQNRQQSASYTGVDGDGNSVQADYRQSSESRFHAIGFSFSVEGELDDGEKEAIGALVKDVSKLADEFFNGDLDKAFEQATQLGFDQGELSGFSLEMTRVEKISVSQAYQQVAQYNDAPKGPSVDSAGQGGQNINQMVKPVANYLKDLMAFLDDARERLSAGNDLQSLVEQSVSKYLEFKGEADITGGLERFAAFNERMLGTLNPDGLNPNGSNSGRPDSPGRPDAPGRSGEAPGHSNEGPGGGEPPGRPVSEAG